MFCKKCYADLTRATYSECPKCHRWFDPNNPKTFYSQPFPNRRGIILQIIATSILGIMAAFIVAAHQATQTSGH